MKERLQETIDSSIEKISGQDATFLYTESPNSPMQIGTLTVVEDSLQFEEFKAIVASKLHLIPKFRKRLLNVPLDLDYPYWVDDPNFDLDLHINRVKLPEPSNWKMLREMTGSIFSNPLDLRRPLWSITFIEGLDKVSQVPKGSVAIVSKVHHVMIDGSSGVGIMGILFDKSEAEQHKPIPRPKPFEPDPLPDEFSLLLKSSYDFFKDPFKIPKLIGETASSMAKAQIRSRFKVQPKLFDKRYPTPKTIFNNSVSPKRTWGTAILSLDRINTLRKIMGVTVNDLILAICAGGIRTYLKEREQLPMQPLVANVPISIREKTATNKELNNQISNMLVRLGTHIEDPLERLEYIHEQANRGKTRHKAIGAKALSKMADAVPFGLANLAAGLYTKYNIKEFHRPPFNVTITNVPGPQKALYIRGRKILSSFGLTPVLDGFGLILAAFSYNGLVTITATSDANTMPDADKFARDIRESANSLEKVILAKKNDFSAEKKPPFLSKKVFTALRNHLKKKANIPKKDLGVYLFIIKQDEEIIKYTLDLGEKNISIRKKDCAKPKASLEIDDKAFFDVFSKKKLLKELIIQGKANLKGSKTNMATFTNILQSFFEK